MSPFSSGGARVWLPFLLLGSSVGFAQLPSAMTLAPDLTLARLTRNSAYIFSGTVLAVQQVSQSTTMLPQFRSLSMWIRESSGFAPAKP